MRFHCIWGKIYTLTISTVTGSFGSIEENKSYLEVDKSNYRIVPTSNCLTLFIVLERYFYFALIFELAMYIDLTLSYSYNKSPGAMRKSFPQNHL